MPKLKDHRYLAAKDKFLEYSFQALQNQFSTKDEFISFFENIGNDDQKNLFLKTASFYLFLVKSGDWVVDVPGSYNKVDYLTDTYKYIAIFSLIESLQNVSTDQEFPLFNDEGILPTIESRGRGWRSRWC